MKHKLCSVLVVGSLLAATISHAATVAQWDFENSTQTGIAPTNGQPFNAGTNSGLYGTADSVSGIVMLGWDESYGLYFSDLTPDGTGFSGYTDNNPGKDGYVIDTAFKGFSPNEWTIECQVKLNELGGWHTIIGKDGSSFGLAESDFYLSNNGIDNRWRLNIQTKAQEQIIIDSDFVPVAGQWYGIACTSDGTTINMWINKQDGTGWNTVGTGTMLGDTVETNALAGNTNFNWTFMRGWYNGGFVDQCNGNLDNVRFSDAVLATNDFLPFPNVPLTPPDAPAERKLWVNGTTNKVFWYSSGTASNYNVYSSATDGGPYSLLANTTNLYYYDGGHSVGETTYYVITALNNIGESGYSGQLMGVSADFTIFGNSDSSYGDTVENYKEAVADGDTDTFYDSPVASGYVGIDLGSGNSVIPTQIAFAPRAGYLARMVGGLFQGSNDGINWDDLITVTDTPIAGWNYIYPETTTAYRYFQYVDITNYVNIGEMQFSEYTPPFYPIAMTPEDGSAIPNPASITLSAAIVDRGESLVHAELYLNGALVDSENSPVAGTNVLSYSAGTLAAGTYTGTVVAAATIETVTNTTVFTVYDPYNGSTMYNINFQNTGAEVSNGVVIIAPSTGANMWNNLVDPGGNSGTWDGDRPVVLTDVNGANPISMDWYGGDQRDFGSNTSLSNALFQGYYGFGTFSDTLVLQGLSPSASYDIIVYFTWGWNENLTTYTITEGSGAVLTNSLAPVQAYCNAPDYADIVEGANYVIFTNISSSASGRIDILAESSDGGFSGLQLIQTSGGAVAEPHIVSISISGGLATLVWDSEAGVTYTIQSKAALTDANWSDKKSGIASAGDGTTSDSVTASADEEFYRVKGQ